MIVAAILVSWLMDRPVAIKPLIVSKLNTGAQIAFAALVLSANAFGLDFDGIGTAGMWIVAALTLPRRPPTSPAGCGTWRHDAGDARLRAARSAFARHAAFWLATLIVCALALYVLRDVLLPFVAGFALAYCSIPWPTACSAPASARLGATIVILVLFVVLLVLMLVLLIRSRRTRWRCSWTGCPACCRACRR
jgi:hypothetical protein